MKIARKKIGVLLLALMVIVSLPLEAFAQYDVSQNTYIDAKKTLTGKTGNNTTLSLVFTNKSGQNLNGVTVMFDRNAAQEEFEASVEEESVGTGAMFPFEITSTTFDGKLLGSIKAEESKSFTLSGRIRRDLSEGYYTVPLLIKAGGNEFRREKVNLWVTKSTGTAESDMNQGTIAFELGEDQNTPFGIYPNVMNFNMNIRNASDTTAFDVNVRMQLDQDSTKFPFDINDGNYKRHYDRIGGGEVIEVPYSMAIREDVYSGYYPLSFVIEYRDSVSGDIQKSENTFFVKIKNKERESDSGEFNANDRSKARIIVDGFETNPETVYAGDEFELILHMKNASENVPASNILFSLESEKLTDSAVFTTDSSSSSVVVNSLAPGQTSDIKVNLKAGAWVDQRTYSITITEKYDSPEFKNAEEKVSVDIPVRQTPRLNTGTIEVMPDMVTVGSESNVMFSINNMGKVTLYNVMVNFTGDSIQQTSTYVGNIKPGETGNVDAMISAIAPTMDDGKVKILITYEDENGVDSEPLEKEMTLMVSDASEMDFEEDLSMMPMDAEPEGIHLYKNAIIASVILVLAVGTVLGVIIFRHIKKKKEAFDEDMDDEI